jgi:hypothetical protein
MRVQTHSYGCAGVRDATMALLWRYECANTS